MPFMNQEEKREAIKRIILCTINDFDPAPWCTIRDAIDEQVEVANWMTVRNILQELIDSRFIKRIDSVHVEAYTR